VVNWYLKKENVYLTFDLKWGNVLKIVQVAFLILFPYLVVKLAGASKKLGFISPILICYIVGIALGNIRYIPVDTKLSMSVAEMVIPLAIPLILFSTDFVKWLHLAKKTVLSFILVIISAAVGSILAAMLFSNKVDEYWKLSGMFVGLYTGGTPNLMAIGMGLNVREETLILANTSDVITGGLYFVFLLTAAKWFYSKFLPRFGGADGIKENMDEAVGKPDPFGIIAAAALSIAFTGVSAGISTLITGKIDVAVVMLLITTLGISASFIKTAIFRIDADTAIITSTAGIYGPAFIGPVAQAIKNREVVISGLTCGLVGYAVGNYLGFAVAWLLMPK